MSKIPKVIKVTRTLKLPAGGSIRVDEYTENSTHWDRLLKEHEANSRHIEVVMWKDDSKTVSKEKEAVDEPEPVKEKSKTARRKRANKKSTGKKSTK